jgi:hypothetical protein
VVICEASREGLGCVLKQDDKVVTYASRQLKKHGENYPTQDLELAIAVYALKIWRKYLPGNKCDIYADQKNLKYFFTQSMLNSQQKIWLVMNKDYQLENHMKGYSDNLRVKKSQPELYRDFEKLKLEIVEEGQLNEMKDQDDLEDHIKQAQKQCA